MKINTLKNLAMLLTATFILQGCVALGLGGAAVATKVGTDPRTVGSQVDDETLELKVYDAVTKDEQIKAEGRVVVVSYSSRVLLLGQVPDESLKEVATSLAKGVENIGDVYNEMRVGSPISFSQKSQDSWITTKIKSDMLLNSAVKTTDIKVITENKEVFLLGNVTQEQGIAAAEVARKVSGVEKVVKVFKYLN
ncbi:divisome-associated lipoprotein YraP [Lonepinella koalarum]|uniref:Osmotically-inducible protein OsmY n=1 Tax=Lonepinella koalarum TaxID=53417 RepID=A0A4R1L2Z7_9PAST|nr:division/outer membrane stress-associated lipid-binding lipoprotein [Lonepinella koalarum]MDH2926773.1 BON domain-containing protein [Lonepinella koalarum]TCK70569.1 osmotically-inducible protein OsmY [Lonepinella koalarum]TFJ90051.1 divisome-associated lipoprotein YraP [Lonepinella koalarum]TYG33854.1 divisome-associated lipoprotein YraP [Lonepinella koalarum]